jgi:hypothetical protein
MKLFEVIYWGHLTPTGYDRDAEDTIYLVRACSHLEALEFVRNNSSQSDHPNNPMKIADKIHKIGTDASTSNDVRILRGPYFNFAYNFGWPSWSSEILDDGKVNWTRDGAKVSGERE